MSNAIIRVVTGFVAGALAVLIFHQGMYVIMQQMGLPLQGTPWNMTPDPNAVLLGSYRPTRLFNQMFWGGMWGILFAFLYDLVPGGMGWLKGLLFGMIFTMLLGSWVFVALIKGQPMFSGAFGSGGLAIKGAQNLGSFDIMRLRNGFLLNGVAFGLGLGIIYPLLAGMLANRTTSNR